MTQTLQTAPKKELPEHQAISLYEAAVTAGDLQTKDFSSADVPSSDENFWASADLVGQGYFSSAFYLKGVYFSNDWVFICCDRIASKLSTVPLRVCIEDEVDGEAVFRPDPGHAINRLLKNPNPWQDGVGLLYSMISDYCATGNGMILHQPLLNNLIHIPSETVNIIFHDGNVPSYYFVNYGQGQIPQIVTQQIQIPIERLIHIKRPNPSSVYWGLSPLIPGNKSVEFYNLSQEFLNNYYIRGAQPSLILKMENEANEQVMLRLLASFEQAYSGRRNQRRTMILPKGVSADQSPTKLAEQELLEFLILDRETMINLFQVPKQELSIQDNSGWNSDEYNQALRNFWNGPLKTIGDQIELNLTKRLKPFLGKKRVIKFDYSVVPQMQENLKEKAETGTALLPTWTLNEIRKQVFNKPPLPGGDINQTIEGQKNTNLLSQFPGFGQMPGQPTGRESASEGERQSPSQTQNSTESDLSESGLYPEDTADQTPISEDIPGVRSKERKWEKNWGIIKKALDDNVGDFWNKREMHRKVTSSQTFPAIRRQATTLFQQQAEAADDILHGRTKASSSEVDRWEQELKAALNKASLKKLFADAYEANTIAQYNMGFNTTLMLPWNLPDERLILASRIQADEAARAELRKRGERVFAQINETTLKSMMKQISAGLDQGMTIGQISDAIKKYFSPREIPWRTDRIARTETLIAASIGQKAAADRAAQSIRGLKKVWLNAGDIRVRGNPSGLYSNSQYDHWSCGGEMVDYNKNFSCGLAYPRALGGAAGNIINCRCDWFIVPPDQAKNLDLEGVPSVEPISFDDSGKLIPAKTSR